jgi:hypothetical protein
MNKIFYGVLAVCAGYVFLVVLPQALDLHENRYVETHTIVITTHQPEMQQIELIHATSTPFVTGMEAIGAANAANQQAINSGHPELVDCTSASAFAAPSGCSVVPLGQPVPAQGP